MRSNVVILVVGTRDVGKTTYFAGSEKDNIKGIVPSYLQKGKRVLVIDTMDHHAWRIAQTININQLETFTGLKRIYTSRTNELLDIIQDKLFNSVLIIEDATRFIEGNMANSIKKFVLESKHRNLDIYFMFHMLRKVPPLLAGVSDYLLLFKTRDKYSKIAEKFDSEHFEQAFYEVKNHPSFFYKKLIDLKQ